jgi:hypothetical protein
MASRKIRDKARKIAAHLLEVSESDLDWETDKTITPSPHHPLGAKGVGESATVGAPPAIANGSWTRCGISA